MWIIYGYVIALVVGVITPVNVTVTCASCPAGGSQLHGIVGDDLVIRYRINKTSFYLIEIRSKQGIIDVSPGIIKLNGPISDRLSVPKTVVQAGNFVVLDITLKKLTLEDNDAEFSYRFTNTKLGQSTGVNAVTVKGPPVFCVAPKKSYNIKAGVKQTIAFSLCGNPKPATVNAGVGLANYPVDLLSSAGYTYKYTVVVRMSKQQCGQKLNITAKNFQTASFYSDIKLLFQPANVRNVTVHRDATNSLTVSWREVKKSGSCLVRYNVKRTADGVTEVHGTDRLTYVFHDAVGNSSISVNAEVNDREGKYSDPVFIPEVLVRSTASPLIGQKGGGLDSGVIVGIVIGIIVIIGIVIALFAYKKWNRGKGYNNSGNYTDTRPLSRPDEVEAELADVNNFSHKQQPGHQPETIYAELGPGGGRTGEKPKKRGESSYASAKTEGVHYPDPPKTKSRPVVSSTSSRSKPSVSSASNHRDDGSFDYESSIVI